MKWNTPKIEPIHFSTIYIILRGRQIPLRAFYTANTKQVHVVNNDIYFLDEILYWSYKFDKKK